MTPEALRVRSPFLAGLSPDCLDFLNTVVAHAEFRSGAVIFDEDDPADVFYIVTEGKVALEIELPARGPFLVETLGPGDLLGISWVLPSARWNWRARVVELTKTVGFDAAAVHDRCQDDHELALHVYKTVAAEAARRLHSTRMRLLDMYAAVSR